MLLGMVTYKKLALCQISDKVVTTAVVLCTVTCTCPFKYFGTKAPGWNCLPVNSKSLFMLLGYIAAYAVYLQVCHQTFMMSNYIFATMPTTSPTAPVCKITFFTIQGQLAGVSRSHVHMNAVFCNKVCFPSQ